MNKDKTKSSKNENAGSGKAPANGKQLVKNPDAANQMLDAVISRGWTLST